MNVTHHKTAFILCGGKSSRMGTEKGLALYKDKALVRHVLDLVAPVFQDVFIIANNPAYTKFGFPVYEDLIPGKGPVGGIYTGLTYSATPWNFFIACDMPFMTTHVIEKMLNEPDEEDAVVAYQNNSPEPLCAFYNKSCLTHIEKQLAENNFKLQDLISLVRVKKVDFTGLFLPESNPFRNINTLEELISINKS
ncbi:MAG: molybdenum cofactor guanylyltransferase [Bacteroidota bacterium]|nr:molybdenum cofactor guanylyltransferase [Bacteroidota bacterium]